MNADVRLRSVEALVSGHARYTKKVSVTGAGCLRLGRFCNRTGTSVDDGARKSNNWFDGLTNRRATNLAPEVVFSPFRALSVVN